jgi:nicotinamidase-related amidase
MVLSKGKGVAMKQKLSYMLVMAIVFTGVLFTFSNPTRAEHTIIDEWSQVTAPAAPELNAVTIDPHVTALLVLDIEKRTCNLERRPRCIASVPRIKGLIEKARANGIPVVYSLTSKGTRETILKEVAPLDGEPVVKSSVDKFYATELENILKTKGIRTVIIVGTAANGAVLGTAIGAAMRKLNIIVPVDGISDKPYSEQYVAWHLVNAPGTRRLTTLTRIDMIGF